MQLPSFRCIEMIIYIGPSCLHTGHLIIRNVSGNDAVTATIWCCLLGIPIASNAAPRAQMPPFPSFHPNDFGLFIPPNKIASLSLMCSAPHLVDIHTHMAYSYSPHKFCMYKLKLALDKLDKASRRLSLAHFRLRLGGSPIRTLTHAWAWLDRSCPVSFLCIMITQRSHHINLGEILPLQVAHHAAFLLVQGRLR